VLQADSISDAAISVAATIFRMAFSSSAARIDRGWMLNSR
jgi:hypothetical protein